MKRIAIAIVIVMALLLIPLTASADPGIEVTDWTGDGEWKDSTWYVDLYAGESASVELKIESSEDTVIFAEYDTPEVLQIYFNPPVLEVKEGKGEWLEVTLYVPGDAAPGEYEVDFTFKGISTETKTETKIVTKVVYRDRDVPGLERIEYVDRVEYVDRIEYVDKIEYVDRKVPEYIETGIDWWWILISVVSAILVTLLLSGLVRRRRERT